MNKRHHFIRLLKFIFVHNKFKCIVALLGIITTVIISVLGSYLVSSLIDDYITPLIGVENPNLNSLYSFILLMVSVYVISIISITIYTKVMMYINQNTLKMLRDKMYEHLETLPIKYFDQNSHGNLMSRFTNDIDALRQMISQSLPQIFSTIISVSFTLAMMFKMNVVLALVTLVLLIIMLIAMKVIGDKSGKYFIKQQANIGLLNGYVNEMVNGQKVIKIFNYEDEVIKGFDKINNDLCDSGTKANRIANICMPLLMNIGIISYVVILVVGSYIAIKNPSALSLGSLAAFLILIRQITVPVAVLSTHLNSIVMASAGAQRIFEILDQEKEFDEGYITLVNATYDQENNLVESIDKTNIFAWKIPSKDSFNLVKVCGKVVFSNVDFGYTDDKTVLHNISLYAKPGQKIAFVGATGAGKTTITNLINRFYDIKNGVVEIDGINIKNIKKDDLRKSLGVVLQDVNLFTGSIKDNIRFGKEDATIEEVIEASILANADSFINLLPQGYDTIITDNGSNLSQGQRQLISIARTAICNPPILILDEATSSIDTRTESLIQKGMDKLMEGKTVFVIAHRLSTIKNSNAIMVLENGNIIERGNHDDLLLNKQTYYHLYTGLFELE